MDKSSKQGEATAQWSMRAMENINVSEYLNKLVLANTIVNDVFKMIDMTSGLSTCVLLSLCSFVVISSLTQSQLSCFSHDRVTSLKCQYLGPGHQMLQLAAMNSSSKQIWWKPHRRVEIWRIDPKWKSICKWRLNHLAVVAKAIRVRVDTRIKRRRSMLEGHTTRVCDLQLRVFSCLLAWRVFSLVTVSVKIVGIPSRRVSRG